MPSFLTDIVWALFRLLGVLFIFAALFLYEDEEGRIRNKVEVWWIKLDDKARSSRSWVATFMQGIAKLTGTGFDRLLGERLLSMRFVVISICLSVSSLFLIGIFILPFVHSHQTTASPQAALLWFLFFTSFGMIPALSDSKLVHGIWWGLIIAFLISTIGFLRFVVSTQGLPAAARGTFLVVLPFAFSFLCDLSYIVLTRWMLRRISKIDHPREIVIQVIANFLTLLALTLVPIFLGAEIFKYWQRAGGILVFSFLLNSIDIFAGFAGLVVALVLLLHRLFWPMVQRPVYAIQRFVPLQKKAWLWAVGMFLLLLPKPRHINVGVLKGILHGLLSVK